MCAAADMRRTPNGGAHRPRPTRRFAAFVGGGDCPPSCQPIPVHYRGRQSGHFLETGSLLPPPAALRRFPRRPADTRCTFKNCHCEPARTPVWQSVLPLRIASYALCRGGVEPPPLRILGLILRRGGQRRPPLRNLFTECVQAVHTHYPCCSRCSLNTWYFQRFYKCIPICCYLCRS